MSSCFAKSYNFISLVSLSCWKHVQSWSAPGGGCFPFRGGLCFHTGCVIGSKNNTLQGTNIPHLGNRKIIFKHALSGGYVSSLEGIPNLIQKHNKLLPLLLTHTHWSILISAPLVRMARPGWNRWTFPWMLDHPNDQVKSLTLGTSSSIINHHHHHHHHHHHPSSRGFRRLGGLQCEVCEVPSLGAKPHLYMQTQHQGNMSHDTRLKNNSRCVLNFKHRFTSQQQQKNGRSKDLQQCIRELEKNTQT